MDLSRDMLTMPDLDGIYSCTTQLEADLPNLIGYSSSLIYHHTMMYDFPQFYDCYNMITLCPIEGISHLHPDISSLTEFPFASIRNLFDIDVITNIVMEHCGPELSDYQSEDSESNSPAIIDIDPDDPINTILVKAIIIQMSLICFQFVFASIVTSPEFYNIIVNM